MLGEVRSKALILSLVATLFVLASLGPAGAQDAYRDVPGIPEGPVGGHIRGLLAALESDNPDVARSFIEASFTPEFLRTRPRRFTSPPSRAFGRRATASNSSASASTPSADSPTSPWPSSAIA